MEGRPFTALVTAPSTDVVFTELHSWPELGLHFQVSHTTAGYATKV